MSHFSYNIINFWKRKISIFDTINDIEFDHLTIERWSEYGVRYKSFVMLQMHFGVEHITQYEYILDR